MLGMALIAFVVYLILLYQASKSDEPIMVNGNVNRKKPSKIKPWIEAAFWIGLLYFIFWR